VSFLVKKKKETSVNVSRAVVKDQRSKYNEGNLVKFNLKMTLQKEDEDGTEDRTP